jgi:hypothetical protein
MIRQSHRELTELAHGTARGRVRQKTWQTYEPMIRTRPGEDFLKIPLSELRPLHPQGLAGH